ncbi:MAG: ATP-binding protein [Pseudomonadota bacterium]
MSSFFRSMSGRVFLILLLGIVASVALTWWFAFGERQRAISQYREAHAVERAEQLILTLDTIPAADRDAFLASSRRFGLRIEPALPASPQAQDPGKQTRFSSALGERLGPDYPLVALPMAAADCPAPRHRPRDAGASPPRPGCEVLDVTLRDQSRIRMTVLPARMPAPPPQTGLIGNLALFLFCIGMLAYAVTRMTMRPLKQLAQAANDLGNDLAHPPLAPHGTSEIRQASAAFNTMQARIRQHIQQRTQMLAAITHDLQTPLTRLRLRLEKVADPALRDQLIGDLSAMQDMVREGLELARSMDSAEPLQALDLDSLLDSVCADAADAGHDVTLEGRTGMSVMARPMALRRCLVNLIDNAVKYGQFAHVRVRREPARHDAGARVDIQIRDGGAGIAADQLQKVFEPFYRIDTSRSRTTGGTGLGLTIARNIAEQHGGSIMLANHAEGGLEVQLILPEKVPF